MEGMPLESEGFGFRRRGDVRLLWFGLGVTVGGTCQEHVRQVGRRAVGDPLRQLGGGGAMVREPQQAWSAHGDAAQGKGPGPQGESTPIRL